MSLTKEQKDEIQRIVMTEVNNALRRRLLRTAVQPMTPQPLTGVPATPIGTSPGVQGQASPGGSPRPAGGAQAQQGGQAGQAGQGDQGGQGAAGMIQPGVNWWTPGQPPPQAPAQAQQPGEAATRPGASQSPGGMTPADPMGLMATPALVSSVAEALVEAHLGLTTQMKSTLTRLREIVSEADELATRMERLLGQSQGDGRGQSG